MAAWQNPSSFHRMPITSESSPTASARGGMMHELQKQGCNHSAAAAANSHCAKSSSDSQSAAQDLSGGTPTITRSVGEDGRESDTTNPASSQARNKTGTKKHSGNGSGGRRGVPRHLVLTPDHIYRPNPISLKESKRALFENDAMVYLDGPQVYTCANCRTHLTSHDDIISKSFHGRNGRAYLFDQCVNVATGPPEDRVLITGLHTVSDISCKRCQALVGWTYAKAYEPSQKYKEGKYIIEKIHLHLEESDYYTVDRPAGERRDKWQVRSMSWGSEESQRAGFGCTASMTSSTTSGSSWSVMMGGSFHRGDSMNDSGGGMNSYYSRGRSASMGGSSSIHHNHHTRSSPQTPPTPQRQSSSSPGMTSITTTTPKSPRSPRSDIIYEYPNML